MTYYSESLHQKQPMHALAQKLLTMKIGNGCFCDYLKAQSENMEDAAYLLDALEIVAAPQTSHDDLAKPLYTKETKNSAVERIHPVTIRQALEHGLDTIKLLKKYHTFDMGCHDSELKKLSNVDPTNEEEQCELDINIQQSTDNKADAQTIAIQLKLLSDDYKNFLEQLPSQGRGK